LLPARHPLCAEATITPEHLQGQQFISLSPQDVIRIQLERLLEEQSIEIARHIEVSMGITLGRLVDQGVGMGLVDGETVSHAGLKNIVVRQFRPKIEMPVYLLRAARRPSSNVEDKFIEYIHANPLHLAR
jgi:DNA-binding transcriptional LysR family regulator